MNLKCCAAFCNNITLYLILRNMRTGIVFIKRSSVDNDRSRDSRNSRVIRHVEGDNRHIKSDENGGEKRRG